MQSLASFVSLKYNFMPSRTGIRYAVDEAFIHFDRFPVTLVCDMANVNVIVLVHSNFEILFSGQRKCNTI